jgi:8-oxo-dGTP pyrophosphatase MutT (NUDIX family)
VKKTGQKYLCRTPYLNVRRDDIYCQDGQRRPYLIVERPDFAVVIPRFPNGDIVMVRQYRYPLGKYTWEFPMGVVKGVSMLKAAKIELQQETGYRARKWTFLSKYYIAPGMMAQMAHVYLAEDLIPGDPEPEEGEFLIAKRIPKATVRRWFQTKKLKDGPSLVAWSFLNS